MDSKSSLFDQMPRVQNSSPVMQIHMSRPQPIFMIKKHDNDRKIVIESSENEQSKIDFTYQHSLIDGINLEDQEIQLKVKPLKDDIDVLLSQKQKDLFFGMKRDKQIECLVPYKVFKEFSQSQPAWFVISSENFSKRICLGLLQQDQAIEDSICLPPKLYNWFGHEEHIILSPLRQDIFQPLNKQVNNFYGQQLVLAESLKLQTVQVYGAIPNGDQPELDLNQLILQFLMNNPMVVQIGDTIQITLKEATYFLKVVELNISSQYKDYYSKILDIKVEAMKDRLLSRLDNQIVNELTFNQYPGYLIHSSKLKNIEVIKELTQSLLPPYSLRYSSLLPILRKCSYYKQVKKQLPTIVKNSNEGLTLVQFYGPNGNGKTTLIQDVADSLGFCFEQLDCLSYYNIPQMKKLLTEEIPDKCNTQGLIVELMNFDKYKLLIDQFSQGSSKSKRDLTEMRFLQTFQHALMGLQQKIQSLQDSKVVLVATCEKQSDILETFGKLFREKITLKNAEKADREAIIEWLFKNDSKLNSSEIVDLDIPSISKYLQGKSFKEIKSILIKVTKVKNKADLNNSLILKKLTQIEKDRRAFGEKAVRIPEVKWADVGGLASAKEDILQTIMLPIEKPHLFQNGVAQRSGLLFYGPPGTGKTLLAKAIATECQMNFISVKGPELLNMYVGESEKNVRDVFERARENLPCIIFFDELDSLAPARGKGADSSQVMDRIVAQLLTEIDGLGKKAGMFTIGATNRPDLLDSALLRTGRFDKMIYLGVAKTAEERAKIIEAQTRQLKLDEHIDMLEIVKNIPENFTGADFSALTTETYMIAVKERIEELELEIDQFKKDNNIPDEDELLPETYLKLKFPEDIERQNQETQIIVRQEHFIKALGKVTPSISLEELRRYEELRDKFSASG